MATVVATSTTPNLGGISRAELFRNLALDTGLLVTGTATSGNTESITDTNQLKTGQSSPSEWIGGWVRISYDAGGSAAAPEGEIRPIRDFQPEFGKVLVEPYFSSSIDIGDKYELWKINPQIVKDLLDQCLTNDIYLPCWTILSEIPDHDMEQTHTTDWTAGGTATVTKQTAQPRLSNSGKRYLRVVSSAAGDYARSALLHIEPGKSYHVSAVARCSAAGTTAKLQAYDETNGAEIQSYTSNRLYPARIWFTITAPSTCHTLSIRLINVETGVTIEWDEVSFFATSSADIPVPWWVKIKDQIKGYFELSPLSVGNQLWDATLQGEKDTRWDTIPNFGGYSRFKAVARQGLLSQPVYVYGLRNETAFSDDNTDLKYLDINLLTACLKFKLYKYHSQPLVTGLLDADNFKSMLGTAESDWMLISQSQSGDLNKIIDSPTPNAYFIDHRFTYGEG